ncbi:LamG domain-containing protein [Hyalangium versicolor]|uniref:LamG domain-containing protein n=1 Tax=Hyalangium versicolor TaxID=2861190 RepID=UPI001CCD6E23|nr:LamG domain-containing protein [Hyalangium versicolor]
MRRLCIALIYMACSATARESFALPTPSARYNFDDGAPEATDVSGNLNTGVFVGGASYQGGSNIAPLLCNVDSLKLNGGGFVSVPNSSSIGFAGSFAISAWVSLDSNKQENNVLSKDTSAWYSNYNLHIFNNHVTLAVSFDQPWSVGTSSQGYAWCDNGGCGTSGRSNFVDAAHPLGTWRHVAAVYDDTTKKMIVYLDGVRDGEAAFNTTGHPRTNTETLQLGRRKAYNSALAGRLDDIRLFPAALQGDQIAELLFCPQQCGGL